MTNLMTDSQQPNRLAHLPPALQQLFAGIVHQVDPWAMQRKLMEISNQSTPAAPELNKDTILYGALVLEEASETMTALAVAVSRVADDLPQADVALADNLKKLSSTFTHVATAMHDGSRNVRARLDEIRDFCAPLLEDEARELADGSTDIAVVNSGLAVAAGLDGAACYLEVASSNLSKANPATAEIDKEANGKWIKGRAYFKPDLDRVIATTCLQPLLAMQRRAEAAGHSNEIPMLDKERVEDWAAADAGAFIEVSEMGREDVKRAASVIIAQNMHRHGDYRLAIQRVGFPVAQEALHIAEAVGWNVGLLDDI